MINRIQTALDRNSRRKIFAVVASFIDWNSAFVRQCPILGIKSFQKNGVRNTLIPLLISYFQERHQSVKWRGIFTPPKRVNGGGPQGATLGIIEYLSQSNNSADCVNPEDRFKFVDDLTILEIVNLLTVGLTSFNIKYQVPNDIIKENKFIPSQNLKSQENLNNINNWTEEQKMKINETKTKVMIFNYTNNYQFSTRLTLNDKTLETVNETKLLGTIVSNDLKWDKNTSNITKKSYTRMELLRKLSSFKAPIKDMKQIYISYIRSLLEQSCTVWHSSLTIDNEQDLERVQKVAFKIILKDSYKNYENAQLVLDLQTLKERRTFLCLEFARKCLKNTKMKSLFPANTRIEGMNPRSKEHFKVNFALTERLKSGPIIFMQNILNSEVKHREDQNKLWSP